MIELCLNLAESRELDFELPADVANLLFNSGENDGAARRWSSGASFAALSSFAALASLPTLAALPTVPRIPVCTFGASSADALGTHDVRLYSARPDFARNARVSPT